MLEPGCAARLWKNWNEERTPQHLGFPVRALCARVRMRVALCRHPPFASGSAALPARAAVSYLRRNYPWCVRCICDESYKDNFFLSIKSCLGELPQRPAKGCVCPWLRGRVGGAYTAAHSGGPRATSHVHHSWAGMLSASVCSTQSPPTSGHLLVMTSEAGRWAWAPACLTV